MFHPEGPTLLELARQALSSTERGYDLLAPKFDVTPFRTPEAVLGPAREYLRREVAPRRLLDLACGTGAVLEREIADACVGVDVSRGMLRVARVRAPGARLVRADALHPPFRRGFDAVTCFGALGHFRPPEQRVLASAVSGCLVPGGHFVFATARRPSRLSGVYWRSRAFNAAMHVRNALVAPPFVMFYMTFLLPEATRTLEAEGFRVRVVAELPEGLVLVDAVRLEG